VPDRFAAVELIDPDDATETRRFLVDDAQVREEKYIVSVSCMRP
jgi:hypothetical protein